MLGKILATNESQPPTHRYRQKKKRIQVKTENSGRKSLGCILGVSHASQRSLDSQHHLQAASRHFFPHPQTLGDQRVRLWERARAFDIVVTPVSMSDSGHRTVYQSHLCPMGVVFGTLLRMVAGPPGNLGCSRPWHEICHA